MGNRKEEILIAALNLFARDGYEAASVSQIAGELGMTKGALYRHYKSKKDIFNCIVERMKQQESEQASDHDMPEDDKERMPEKYETVSLDDFVKYNIMKEILIFMVRVVSDRQASMVSVITDCRRAIWLTSRKWKSLIGSQRCSFLFLNNSC